jgi:predicted RNA polymerase sigma factor
MVSRVRLETLDALDAEPSLARYHLLPSVRGDLLLRLGRDAEARSQFRRAAELCDNEPERKLLLSRATDDAT